MSEKVKVLHFFKRMDLGGAEMRTIDIMKNINKNNYEFHYCVHSSEKGELDDIVIELGGHIHYCGLDWKFPLRLHKIIKENKIDVIHAHTFMFSGVINFFGKLYGVPRRISHFRSSGDGKNVNIINKIKKNILKHLVGKCSTNIVAVSKETMKSAWGEDWAENSKCQVIYNGIDIKRIYNDIKNQTDNHSYKAEQQLPNDAKIIIHVGRDNPAKNYSRLISIFKEFNSLQPNSYLVLAGNVNCNRIKYLIKKEKVSDKVKMLGPRNDIFRLLHNSDLMIFPSIREGLPGAVLEAVSVGLPVIATDLAVIKEINDFTQLTYMNLNDNDNNIAQKALLHMNSVNKNRNLENDINYFTKTKYNIETCVFELSNLYSPR